jgi:Peptidase family M48
VDEQLADFLGSQKGLWAAALSHEVAHVNRRDWARRYLFEKSLRIASAGEMVLRESAGNWLNADASLVSRNQFLQQMEMEADEEVAMLMARAGFHPFYMQALYQLLRGQPHRRASELLDASHPVWRERSERLRRVLVVAGKSFDQRWPDSAASPGGNAPVLVYAGTISRRYQAGVWRREMEISVPLNCQNLYGSVDVVLQVGGPGFEQKAPIHRFTGCTSSPTWVSFTVAGDRKRDSALISVFDNDGALLARWAESRLTGRW